MLALAGTYPTVYVDTSASEPARYPEEFVEFLRAEPGGRSLRHERPREPA